jgi:hypothetical protein
MKANCVATFGDCMPTIIAQPDGFVFGNQRPRPCIEFPAHDFDLVLLVILLPGKINKQKPPRLIAGAAESLFETRQP